MSELPRYPLGSSDLQVSAISLGSWETFERISREEGLAVLRRARELGIDFLDDARYDDRTGTAPLRSGWSEVVFGELLHRSNWPRAEVAIANKLWWEFWPQQSAADELDASLARMGLDHVDLIYAAPPPAGLDPELLVEEMTGLVSSGRARAWGMLNWSAGELGRVVDAARAAGVAGPCAAQLPYSVVHPTSVESPAMQAALARGGTSTVASASLASGALTGKYTRHDQPGRLQAALDQPRHARAAAAGARLAALGTELDASAAELALAFALAGPSVASVLVGATRPEQLDENVRAAATAARLSDGDLAAVRAAAPPATAPAAPRG